jgi:hypothetical protein
MGAAGSKGTGVSVENPFPVSPSLNRDLDKLSMVAARILSSPDIYDIENLSRPGVCGDYVVLLKKHVEKEVKLTLEGADAILQPFTVEADIDGKGKKRVELYYGNPRKAMTDKAREEICKNLTNSLLRTIAIIVASLASIQVAMPSRKAVVSGIAPPVQKGGGGNDVLNWLVQNGYILSPKPIGMPMEIQVFTPELRGRLGSAHFFLTLASTTGNVTTGTITTKGTPLNEPEMPAGALRVQFVDPVSVVPAPGNVQVLPLRLLDAGSMPWAAGFLFQREFKSFNTRPGSQRSQTVDFTTMLYYLFRKTQGLPVSLARQPETQAEIQVANRTYSEVQKAIQNTGSPQPLIGVIQPFLAEVGLGGGAPPPGYGYPPPGYAQPVYAQPQYPGVAGIVPYPGAAVYPAGPGGLARGPGLIGAPQGLQYTIPQSASKTLLDTLKDYRGKLAIENSPAAIRAQALAGAPLPNRDIKTNLCQDPYWTQPSLSQVYPWATLQFLCVKDWSTLTGDRSKVVFESEWDTFLNDLEKTYSKSTNDGPELVRDGSSKFLDRMKITNVQRLAACSTGGIAQVKFKEVNDGLLEIQGLYERHVPRVWEVLNRLIFLIKDPDTGIEHVRLNPEVLKAASSADYVSNIAEEARTLIATFYNDVENAYVRAAKALKAVRQS